MRAAPFVLTSLVAIGLFGCPDKKGTGDPTDAGGAAVVTPGEPIQPAPPELELQVRLVQLDGGTTVIPLEGGEQPEIEPVSALEVTSNLPLRNYRVRLFDEVDRAMVSDDVAEETDGGIRYQIALPSPLKTGHKYTVVLDPQTGPEFTDAQGRAYAEKRVTMKVAGEKEKPPPPKKRRRR